MANNTDALAYLASVGSHRAKRAIADRDFTKDGRRIRGYCSDCGEEVIMGEGFERGICCSCAHALALTAELRSWRASEALLQAKRA